MGANCCHSTNQMAHEKALSAIESVDSSHVLIVFSAVILNLLPTKILTRYDSMATLCRLIVLVSSFCSATDTAVS